MLDSVEAFKRGAAHALRRAVRRHKLGMFGLQVLEPPHEPVVVEIRDRRRRFDKIPPIVPADLIAKPVDFLLDVVGHAAWAKERLACNSPPSKGGVRGGTIDRRIKSQIEELRRRQPTLS